MMGMKVWAMAWLVTGLGVLGSASAQEPTRCPPAQGQQTAAAAQELPPGCRPAHDDLSDTDKALGIALLGCAVAFASHVARRRSAKVVLS